ncbi:MAG: hypothetical protein COV67_08150 [Nitrospinae bacterium CG11_big_fil_rev_8_21_14_0_20_56_8]|nr:MAG: hypothetical protein COV67_08150 [Nitrospinae bacterium CG11_big_fil_rev_8_21_14_0_20_56_8]
MPKPRSTSKTHTDWRDPFVDEATPPPGYRISRARKIVLGLFIIGFWLFFYWYREMEMTPPAPLVPPSETIPESAPPAK